MKKEHPDGQILQKGNENSKAGGSHCRLRVLLLVRKGKP